jgi:drug/metabolite transporter (DMT)-like permease
MNRVLTITLAVLCVLLSTAAQIALKMGVSSPSVQSALMSKRAGLFLARALANPIVITGFSLYVISVIAWLLVLAKLAVSFAYPFVSLGFVLIAVYAHFGLHEPLSTFRIVGISLIFAGVLLVAKS